MENYVVFSTPLLVNFRIAFIKKEEMDEKGDFVEKISVFYPIDLLN